MFNSTMPGRVLVILVVAMLAAGCQTMARKANVSFVPSKGARVLMMTPDVQLFEMQASGLLEPKAEWTDLAKTHVSASLNQQIRSSGAIVVDYQAPTALEREQAHQRLINLHRAVGNAIRLHQEGALLALPSKQGKFDWTLGPGVQALGREYDADYAFFLHIRDSYTSAGRAAVVVAAALLGVGVTGGQQYGFVSLVDLKTGQVVWVNQTFGAGGDLRTPEPAAKAVTELLSQFPI